MTELFVSYCRDDAAVMEPIVENLRQLGFDLWVDIEVLEPGTPDWVRAVDEALRRADGVLAFLSPAAKESEWCHIETLRAKMYKKPIYPILIFGESETAVPLHLTGAQFADMRGRASRQQNFKKLVKKLARDFDYPLPEFDLKPGQSGSVPVVNIIHVSGHVEGNVYALNVGGDVTGEVNIAGGDIVQQTQASPPSSVDTPKPIDILDILPPPFEWCEIPAGRVGIKGQSFDVQPFRMAKYPITYEQFYVFIDRVDGFYNDHWWQDLEHRESPPGRQRFTHAQNLPRENVSWYDAVAFCRWLSSKTGSDIRLPTEWEWQWAAQGPDGRVYPWGNDFDKSRCNTSESGLSKTTLVEQYPNGASPFSVMDMSGNVWEWCLNEYGTPQNISTTGDAGRVLRGGSFGLDRGDARAAVRSWSLPYNRSLNFGFRVVLLPSY
ncbi:MAG: SUMF1/EgtB/PvdO family nonheme iron enzyme [Anaerolineae bacterium]|nr:SUMF1/EgtB/PvdO family nonheme iron enzyme [Anaerolineae bacterium]